MLDAEGLIRKHQAKGALVDSNLLVLFLVGTIKSRRTVRSATVRRGRWLQPIRSHTLVRCFRAGNYEGTTGHKQKKTRITPWLIRKVPFGYGPYTGVLYSTSMVVAHHPEFKLFKASFPAPLE
jgi:hypothetical protein